MLQRWVSFWRKRRTFFSFDYFKNHSLKNLYSSFLNFFLLINDIVVSLNYKCISFEYITLDLHIILIPRIKQTAIVSTLYCT